MRRARCWGMFVFLLFLALPSSAETRSLAFELDCLDLDTGAVDEDSCRRPAGGAGWDIVVSYHADRAVPAVIRQNIAGGVTIAHLEGVAFADVTAADASAATFHADLVDTPFDAGLVVLVRTDSGAIFKIGNPSEEATGLTFEVERL